MPISAANLHFAAHVQVFDAHICVGSGRSQIGPVAERPALLAELDRFGIECALAYHIHSEEFSAIHGNQLLEEWLGADQRLVPLWAALPTEQSLVQLQTIQQAGRLHAARLMPTPGLPFADWTHGDLLAWLSAIDVPLWIALPDLDARDLVSTLRNYPHLRVVIAGAHYSHTILIQKLLAALPNASLEISRYESLDAINDIISRFGAERLLYGSWYPRYALGPMLYFLHHCGLSEAELAAICAGNLQQLLKLPEARHDI